MFFKKFQYTQNISTISTMFPMVVRATQYGTNKIIVLIVVTWNKFEQNEKLVTWNISVSSLYYDTLCFEMPWSWLFMSTDLEATSLKLQHHIISPLTQSKVRCQNELILGKALAENEENHSVWDNRLHSLRHFLFGQWSAICVNH